MSGTSRQPPASVRRTRSSREVARLSLAVAVLLVLALVIAGTAIIFLNRALSSDDLAGGADQDGPMAAPSQVDDISDPLPAALLEGGLRYVALGDSYSAGPGIPDQRTDPVACSRSTHNYPSVVARLLEVGDYRDATCTGARTTDLARQQVRPGEVLVPRQLDALSPDTELVTLSLGGNDRDLFGRLVGSCPELARQDPSAETPCQDAFTVDGVDTLLRDAASAQQLVAEAIGLVRSTAPGAQVVVVGYPQVVPREGSCTAAPFAPAEYAWVRRVVATLVEAMAAAARDAGVRFVDLTSVSEGHDICSQQPWINGATLAEGRAWEWHPFREGMEAFGREVVRQLTDRSTGS